METRASHVLIGSFALVIVAAAFLFVLWLGKLSLDREWAYYDVVFGEAVTGLSVGSAVQYNGIQVGEVRRLQLAPDDPSQVWARIRVGGDTPVRTDTTARLTFTGLTGVAIIQLGGGSSAAPPLYAERGEVSKIYAEESAIGKLMASGEDIVLNVNQLLLRVSVLLSDENVAKVAATIDHVEQLSATLAGRGERIGEALDDIAAAGAALRQALQQVEQLTARLDSIAARTDSLLAGDGQALLASARESVEAARRVAESAARLLEDNRDAFDRFSEQGLGQAGAALAELRQTLARLRQLGERLQGDPARVLTGADQPKEYDPR